MTCLPRPKIKQRCIKIAVLAFVVLTSWAIHAQEVPPTLSSLKGMTPKLPKLAGIVTDRQAAMDRPARLVTSRGVPIRV